MLPNAIPRSRRSSTHRSIAGTSGSFRHPTWRSSTLSQCLSSTPTAAVSIVYARPELVDRSGVVRELVVVDPGPSEPAVLDEVQEEVVGDPAGGEQPEVVAVEVTPPPLVVEPPMTTAMELVAQPSTSPTHHDSLSLPELASTPTPTLAPNSTPSPQNPSQIQQQNPRSGRSWFSSFSRSKGKKAMRELEEETHDDPDGLPPPPSYTYDAASAPTPESWFDPPPPPPATESSTFTPLPLSAKTPPRSMSIPITPQHAHAPVHKRSWFSPAPSLPSSPPGVMPVPPALISDLADISASVLHTPSTLQESPIESMDVSADTKTINNKDPSPPSPPPSLGDLVVSSPPTPPADQTRPQGPAPKLGHANISAPSPTPSRFTLSIPFLGRAKVPLDVALGADKAGDANAGGKTKENGMDQTASSTSVTTIKGDSMSAELSSSPITVPISTINHPTHIPSSTDMSTSSNPNLPSVLQPTTPLPSPSSLSIPSSSKEPDDSTVPQPAESQQQQELRRVPSWLRYVGWSSAGAGGATDVVANAKVDEPSIENPGGDAVEGEAAGLEQEEEGSRPRTNGEAGLEHVKDHREQDEHQQPYQGVPAVVAEEAEVEVETPAQVQHTELVTSSSSWYTPWTWNHSKATADDHHLHHVEDEKQGVEAETEAPTTTYIDTPTPATEPEPPMEPTPTPPLAPALELEQLANPITASIHANRSGWASFFSSRTLTVKRLGYTPTSTQSGEEVKRDENGVEVMDLDLDEDEGDKDSGDVKINGGPTPVQDTGPSIKVSTSQNGYAKPTTDALKAGKSTPPVSSKNQRQDKKSGSKTPASQSTTPKRSNSGASTPIPPPIDKPKSATPVPSSPAKRPASPSPSKKSFATPPPPNLVLPSWTHTFHAAPRNVLPPKPRVDDQGVGVGVGGKLLGKTMQFVTGVLFPGGGAAPGVLMSGKGKERETGAGLESLVDRERQERFRVFGKELPKAWRVLEEAGWDTTGFGFGLFGVKGGQVPAGMGSGHGGPGAEAKVGGMEDVLRGCKQVVVIGIHGWFPGAMIRTVLGEPTGTSSKFANMMEQALLEFENDHNVKFDKITKIPLEGDGTIERRVERLYDNLKANAEWMRQLHDADAILVATHSQGSVVSTHLLDRLIRDGHIVTARNSYHDHHRRISISGPGAEAFPSPADTEAVAARAQRKVQRVCCLALCGIHLGPLRYLGSSTLVGPYLQYFESTAARELFEFQNTESAVSKAYVRALENVLDHGTKMLLIASMNDQVVPIYSGLFTAASHPLLLRAMYIDGDAYHSSDFLSNLLVLLLRMLNSGISDSGLIAHLSEATAGSLNGVGHSTAYEELATYSLAVNYLFLTNNGMAEETKLVIEPFNATHEQNDYEIPWSLRDIIADERVFHFFSSEITNLKEAFREWHPRTSILRDLKRKLQPIQRLPVSFSASIGPGASTSKL